MEFLVRTSYPYGEIIERYPDDSPYPSLLIYRNVSGRPVHTVVAYSSDQNKAYIVTAYKPTDETFEDDFRTRRDD